jgi:hypothetical protein
LSAAAAGKFPAAAAVFCRCYTAAAAVEVLRRRQQLGLEEKVL